MINLNKKHCPGIRYVPGHQVWQYLVALLLLCQPVSAETLSFGIDSFEVSGENPLSAQETTKLLGPFAGLQKNLEDLQSAVQALEQAIHASGYSFDRVILPQQSLSDGVIELKVVPFKVGQVSIEGAEHHDEANIRASLPGLVEGESPNTRELSRSIAVGRKQPSKSTRLTFAASDQTGEVDARIAVKDKKPWQAFSWFNDTGTDETGNTRMGFGLQHSNLFNRDQNAVLTYTLSPEKEDKVAQYGLLYQIPFYDLGGELNLLYSKSDVDTGTVATFFDVAGKGEVFAGTYTQVFARKGGYSQELSVSVFDKLFENEIFFDGQPIGVDVRSRPLGLRYSGSLEKPGYQMEFFLRPQANLPGGSRNDDVIYGLSRAGAKSDWSRLRFALSGRKYMGRWSAEAQISGQYADEPLIISEQFGAGGIHSVRGFTEREVSGDKGFRYSVQLLAPPVSKQKIRTLAFIDGGQTHLEGALPGEIESESILSTGVGLRWNWSEWVSLVLDWGYVLNGVDERRVGGTQEGDSRFHFNLFMRY